MSMVCSDALVSDSPMGQCVTQSCCRHGEALFDGECSPYQREVAEADGSQSVQQQADVKELFENSEENTLQITWGHGAGKEGRAP